MMREGLTLLGVGAALVATAGCDREKEPEGRMGAAAGAAGVAGAAGGPAVDSPYFLYEGGVTAVDDRYLYSQGGYVVKEDKRGGGTRERMFYCDPSKCYKGELVADGGYLYLLADYELWRVNREDGTKETVVLPWSHLLRGGIAVDETYAYTIMPGCAAITRIDKRTLAFDPAADVTYIEAPFPEDAGNTTLVRAGERLVCGTPGKLFVVDEWGQGRLLAEGFREHWGLVAVGEYAYWVGKPPESAQTTVYRVPLSGGQLTVLATHASVDVPVERIRYSASRGQIVYGTNLGLRTFTIATGVLEEAFDIGVVHDIALDDQFVYAGVGTQGPDLESVYWAARVPLSDLPPAGLAEPTE